ncbi:hypothetical protein TRFO_04752 [Tritrichomonas foetus]|uniref:Myb-like DNA-binding domain containing protein n=1 Tax=Tritrichomonas foetus TaxID=1144522 RepID=A0A1J4KB95_9EUKA|nr:hypothetical protein TRFO_04752 [Tritrichomonas foetus]|eukprot:OHT08689.1 hypothetical protein TRFO_04752 [Tritrichomonas foetus]
MPRNFNQDVTSEIECDLPCDLFKKQKSTRQKFTPEEDELIARLVGDAKFPQWNEIARSIPGKTGRQCRERYQHYLSPNLSRHPWARWEDELIISLYRRYGPNWATIATHFNGRRTNNNIKNRWNNHLIFVTKNKLIARTISTTQPILPPQQTTQCPSQSSYQHNDRSIPVFPNNFSMSSMITTLPAIQAANTITSFQATQRIQPSQVRPVQVQPINSIQPSENLSTRLSTNLQSDMSTNMSTNFSSNFSMFNSSSNTKMNDNKSNQNTLQSANNFFENFQKVNNNFNQQFKPPSPQNASFAQQSTIKVSVPIFEPSALSFNFNNSNDFTEQTAFEISEEPQVFDEFENDSFNDIDIDFETFL